MLRALSLFSGIGGIDLGLSDYAQTRLYCEKDEFCQYVLLQNMQKGNLPEAPIWTDIRTLTSKYIPPIDIIHGGFPCQGFSVKGDRGGLEHEQSSLFSEMLRIICEVYPPFVFLENVEGFLSHPDSVECIKALAASGYDIRWGVFSAEEAGAVHQRKRVFFLAHSACESHPRPSSQQEARKSGAGMCCEYPNGDSWKKTLSSMDCFADGIPSRVAKLKALGNAVVPAQAKLAFEELLGLRFS